MDTTELLKLADALMFMKTGKRLDHTQRVVLEGTFQGKTYAEIAEETYQSEGHVRNIGAELWKALSEQLGEEVTKSTCRAILENAIFHRSSAIVHNNNNHIRVQNLNVYSEGQSPANNKYHNHNSSKPHLNLGDAPEIRAFYGRETELATLQNQLLEQHCRLITLLGFRGIGKTTLALQLVEQVKPQFDYIIYRSLFFAPTPETTISNLLQVFSPTEIPPDITTQLSQLFDYLRKYRCLIILDDIQMLFAKEQLAGHYQNSLENYQRLFTLAAEVNHNSCLLLNSSEKPRDIANLEKNNQYCRSLVLGSIGNAAEEICRSQNLRDEAHWLTLINIYQGNPSWLKFTIILIQELCGGSTTRFLAFEMPIICESLQELLDESFNRLTEKEKLILSYLADRSEPVGLDQIISNFELSATELFKILHSLRNRLWIDVTEGNPMIFSLSGSILKEYIKKIQS